MLLNHLPITKEQISPCVLLPGDPERVDLIGTYLDEFRILGQRREFRAGKGLLRGLPVLVVSTGIGCPSTAIAAEELIGSGAEYLIRVGTCGGAWRREIAAGSLIVPTACVRDEGTTGEYVLPGFPAVADLAVVNSLCSSAAGQNVSCFAGINRTHDAFYGAPGSITKWGTYLAGAGWKGAETPIISSDMESAALFVVASLRGAKAGAVLAVNADPEPLADRIRGETQSVNVELSSAITEKTVAYAIKTALGALQIITSNLN